MSLPRRRRCPPLRRGMVPIAWACSLALVPAGASAGVHIRGNLPAARTLERVFGDAAREFHVPQDVLLAVSYNVSRWEWHAGPSTSGGYGGMHLLHHRQPPPFRGPPPPPAAAPLRRSPGAVRPRGGGEGPAGGPRLSPHQRAAVGAPFPA